MVLKQMLASLVIAFSIGVCFSASVKSAVPTFSDYYFIQGIILLPYAEIKEPFTAFYDLPNKKSRVDYYGDLQKTFQRQDVEPYGVSYKISYMPSVDDPTSPQRTCFQVNGTKDTAVTIQNIIPDLSDFAYVSTGICPSSDFETKYSSCEVWYYANTIGNKNNNYTMWIAREADDTPIPVFYEMMGYDSLLGSHYDKYQIEYDQYTIYTIPSSVFEIGENLTCRGFPGPGVQKLDHVMNPIQEYVNNIDHHNINAFDDFKSKFNKTYESAPDHMRRLKVFRQNFRYINSINRQSRTFTLKVNHLADLDELELQRIRGRKHSSGYNGGLPFNKEQYSKDIPESIDWRLYGAVTPVKDQAICGSCWSFGTTGTLEGAYFLKNKNLKRFSQQQLVDCSWNFQNNGCDGGEDFRAYQYIMKYGLSTEDDYGPYLGVNGQCHAADKTFTMTGYVNVTSGDNEALRIAIANHGPISVSIDASHKSLSFYSNGVYYDPDCMNRDDQLDHSVLAVGYGVLNGEPYWLVKNSWSTYWGNDGYVLMSQKDNNCGVSTSATHVII